jgi:hypothetical protein
MISAPPLSFEARILPGRIKRELVSRVIRLTNSAEVLRAAFGCGERPYGVADGEGDGEGLASLFLVDSFLVVVDSFLAASVEVSFLVDFLVVVDSFFAGDFSGAVVVVDVSVLVVQELMSPAANRTVME